MSILEKIQISKYKKVMKQIETLNIRNAQGYNTFAEYCIADEEMISYFKELKKIEKNLKSLTVDSYEVFEKNLFLQLNKIYNNKINDIFEKKDLSIDDEEFLKTKKINLEKLKTDISNGYGHNCDKMVDLFIEDISEKINNYDKYTYSIISNSSIDNIENDFIDADDPLLSEAMEYILESRSNIYTIHTKKTKNWIFKGK